MLLKSISRFAVIMSVVLSIGFASSAVPQDMKNMPGMKMGNSNSQKKRTTRRNKPAAKKHNMANMPGMNMPTPGGSPSHGTMQNMPGMDNMQGMGSMNIGPLMVMRGNEMAVRIGDSEANVMDLGLMGSATSWEPDTSPSYMMDKQA